MNVRILAAGIPAAIVIGWLGWSRDPGDVDAIAWAGAFLILVLLAASGRNWARLVAAAWISILGAIGLLGVAMATGIAVPGRLLGLVLAGFFIGAAVTIARERSDPKKVA